MDAWVCDFQAREDGEPVCARCTASASAIARASWSMQPHRANCQANAKAALGTAPAAPAPPEERQEDPQMTLDRQEKHGHDRAEE